MSNFPFDLNTDITYLKGVGPRRAAALNHINIFTFYDFLTHYPRYYEDEREVTPMNKLMIDETAIVVGHLSNISFKEIRSNLKIINAILEDDTDYIQVTWFNQDYLKRKLSNGMKLMVKGKVSEAYGSNRLLSITVQAFDILGEDENPNLGIFPVYPSTAALNQKFFRTTMRGLLERLPKMKEILPRHIVAKHELIPYDEAIRSIHFPHSRQDLSEARYRLAFNELFLIQYGLMLIKKETQEEERGISHEPNGRLMKNVLKALPFKLTGDSKESLRKLQRTWKDQHQCAASFKEM